MVKGITFILASNVNFQNEAGQNKAGSKYKVFPVVAGQDEQPPYSVVRTATYIPTHCKAGKPMMFTGTFEVYSFDKNYEDVIDLDEAVIDALSNKAGTFNGVSFQFIRYEGSSDSDYDVDRNLYSRVSTFTAIVNSGTIT